MYFEAFWQKYLSEFKTALPFVQDKCREILSAMYEARYLKEPINLSDSDKTIMGYGSAKSIEDWIVLIDEHINKHEYHHPEEFDWDDYYKPISEKMSFEEFKTEAMKDVVGELTMDDLLHMLYGDQEMPESLAIAFRDKFNCIPTA